MASEQAICTISTSPSTGLSNRARPSTLQVDRAQMPSISATPPTADSCDQASRKRPTGSLGMRGSGAPSGELKTSAMGEALQHRVKNLPCHRHSAGNRQIRFLKEKRRKRLCSKRLQLRFLLAAMRPQ